MFSDRFNSLMNIAEVSNSLLGRDIHMNPSHIGRLRSGARKLAKKHNYLHSICAYLASHIKKDYQINALQRLTGIYGGTLASSDKTADFLEKWLLENERDTSAYAEKLLSGFARISSAAHPVSTNQNVDGFSEECPPYLYGNEGKRKAVVHFFRMILNESTPQTLLLFSDENMAWLYEDAAFAAQWTNLFSKVLAKGNRVRIIHTVSRDINEMFEALTKWIPIYMTGSIEPYSYPRLRDGLFQRTLFIAPKTAAVVSSSVQQNTDGMLNMLITDHSALNALVTEFDNLFAFCRPLMKLFTDFKELARVAKPLFESSNGDEFLCSAVPPIFTVSQEQIADIARQIQDEKIALLLKKCADDFRKHIENHKLTLTVLNPEIVLSSDSVSLPLRSTFSAEKYPYTCKQYKKHIEYLQKLESECENFTLNFSDRISENTVIYVKNNASVILTKADHPSISFVINEKNMVTAFWDCIEKRMLF